MRVVAGVAGVAMAMACTPVAEPGGAHRYACAGGQTLTAVYGMEGETAKVDITFSEGTFLLYGEPAASGARYGWPSGGTTYVWLTKGRDGTLLLKDGSAGGEETPVLTDCRQS